MKKRNRFKRLYYTAVIVVSMLSLSGCWNYRGLDQIAIVAGMALDYQPESNQYRTTFEIVNLSKPVDVQGLSTYMLDSEGETIFQTIRNARKKIKNRLYFGHMMTVIISEELAKRDEVAHIANWFMRDAECRETMYFLVSQEKSAAEILTAENLESSLLSYEIESILENDRKHVLSTTPVQLFEIYSELHTCGSLSLPAVHLVSRDGKRGVEVNGAAVFRGRTLAGYLSPEDTKYMLFALDKVEGGLLTVQCPGKAEENITLEIERSKTTRALKVSEGEKVISLKVTADVFVGETAGNLDALDENQISLVAEAAQKKLDQRIKEVIERIRSEFGTDVLAFCELIQKHDPALWRQIKDSWDNEFKELSVEVTSKVNIRNTAMLKK